MGKIKKLSFELLKAKAGLALDSPALVEIARSANSPNQAYEQTYLETGDAKKSIACQNLAKIKRDFGKKAFDAYVSSVVSASPRPPKGTGKNKKGGNQMAQETIAKKRTEKKASNGQPSIPLKRIEYRSVVNGAFAQVRVVQIYCNDAAKSVEAIYVFPLPDEATVIGCKMKIGERTITAQIKERQEARQEYDEAVSAGHHGVLMEQERPNIFTMNVGGIEPNEDIKVEIDYVQRVGWQDGGGRFRIPLVVAPRFIPGNPTGKTGGGWAPDTDQVSDASRITPIISKEGAPYNADINVSFAPGFACELSCPTHAMIVAGRTVKKDETVEIKTGEIRTDRDFILVYRSLSAVPECAVHGWTDGQEAFRLVSIIPSCEAKPVASDIVVLLDRSGSMNGAKIDGAKVIAKNVLVKLREQNLGHQVAVGVFDDLTEIISSFGDISDNLLAKIAEIKTQGGTELSQALTCAKNMFCGSSRSRIILLITDGQFGGVFHSFKLKDFGQARIIAAGVDTAVNDSLLNELARKTKGACQWFYPGEDFDHAANTLVGMLSGPVLRDIKVDSSGQAVGISDVFAGRPATIAIRFANPNEVNTVITGVDSEASDRSWGKIVGAKAMECEFAPQIWAREFIRESQKDDETIKASLQYGVICSLTSFVAISEKKVPGQKPVRCEIPVNLPKGWNYESVFGSGIQCLTASFGGVGDRGMLLGAHVGAGIGARRLAKASNRTKKTPRLGGNPNFPGPNPLGPPPYPRQFPAFPVLPSLIQPPQSSTRFTLEASDLVDRLVGILIALSQGKREEAEQAFQNLGLTALVVSSWDEEKRSKAYCFAVVLISYGFNFSQDILTALARELTNANALAWRNLARKENGLPFDPALPASGLDGYEYLVWKFGRGKKPVQGDWALVP